MASGLMLANLVNGYGITVLGGQGSSWIGALLAGTALFALSSMVKNLFSEHRLRGSSGIDWYSIFVGGVVNGFALMVLGMGREALGIPAGSETFFRMVGGAVAFTVADNVAEMLKPKGSASGDDSKGKMAYGY